MRRRSRRRGGGAQAFVFFVLCVVFMIMTGLLLVARYKESKKPVYEYVSMTDEAAAKAYVWLSQIEDTELSYEDVEGLMGSFNLEVIKTPTGKDGSYDIEIAQGSYDYCVAQAKLGFEKAYKSAVQKRLIASEYEGEITDDLVDSLMQEAYGVSVSEYLNMQNIAFLPEETALLEEIKSRETKALEDKSEKNSSLDTKNNQTGEAQIIINTESTGGEQ